jgi:RHS repeat-associated protein
VVDGRNRRVGRKVAGRLVQGWLYQNGLNRVAELDSAGNVVARYVYGTRGHVPEYVVKGDTTFRLVTDQLGSVRAVVNSMTGEVAEWIDYDAWGRVKRDTNPGFVSLGYAGGLRDTATGLVRFGARDYDPSVGRWTCKDPLRFGGGDWNLYAYVLDDPVQGFDSDGRRRYPYFPFDPADPGANAYDDLRRMRDRWREEAKTLPGTSDRMKNIWEHAQFSREAVCRYGPVFTVILNTVKEYQDMTQGQSGDEMIRDLQSDLDGMYDDVPSIPPRIEPFGGFPRGRGRP